jgi:hypothetical protein
LVFNEFLCEKCFLTFDLDFWKTAPYFLLTTKLFWKYEHCRVEWYMTQPYIIHDDYILEMMSLITGLKCRDNIQLMTFHEVNTRIDQPMEMIFTEAASAEVNIMFHGLITPCIHRNWKSLTVLLYDIKSNLSQYSIKFIIIYCCKEQTLFPRHPCLPNVCHY